MNERQKLVLLLAATLLLGVLTITTPIPGSAQTNARMNAEVSAARAAGAYLGSLQYLHELKSTKCGYVLRKPISSLDDVANREILPRFSQDSKREIEKMLPAMKDNVRRTAPKFVGDLIAKWTSEMGGDEKTVCGLVTGLLLGIHQRATETWLATVKTIPK